MFCCFSSKKVAPEEAAQAKAKAKAAAKRIAKLPLDLVIEDYRDPESIHAQLLPRRGLKHPPVKLLKWEWMETRADKLRAATTDEGGAPSRCRAGRTSRGTSRTPSTRRRR